MTSTLILQITASESGMCVYLVATFSTVAKHLKSHLGIDSQISLLLCLSLLGFQIKNVSMTLQYINDCINVFVLNHHVLKKLY